MKTWLTRFLVALSALFALSAAGCGSEADDAPTPAPPAAPTATAPAPTAAAKAVETPAAQPSAPVAGTPTETATPSASAAVSQRTPSDEGDVRTLDADDLEIVTLLGYDAIRAILEPEFVDAEQADEWLEDGDLVIGVSINGDSRAYTVPMLSVHEIVNDVVGGEPIAVTW